MAKNITLIIQVQNSTMSLDELELRRDMKRVYKSMQSMDKMLRELLFTESQN